ncbi:hypothetical protein BD413DRAFT_266707 [Trametes elegans]|nr:hypothetical protein BD413DRAFT_266707 [Trametes elegans]
MQHSASCNQSRSPCNSSSRRHAGQTLCCFSRLRHTDVVPMSAACAFSPHLSNTLADGEAITLSTECHSSRIILAHVELTFPGPLPPNASASRAALLRLDIGTLCPCSISWTASPHPICDLRRHGHYIPSSTVISYYKAPSSALPEYGKTSASPPSYPTHKTPGPTALLTRWMSARSDGCTSRWKPIFLPIAAASVRTFTRSWRPYLQLREAEALAPACSRTPLPASSSGKGCRTSSASRSNTARASRLACPPQAPTRTSLSQACTVTGSTA